MTHNIQHDISSQYQQLTQLFSKEYHSKLILPNIQDLEKEFTKVKDPVIINNIPQKSKYMEVITDYICDISDRSSLIISCKCKKYQGFYYEGKTCEVCNTKVSSNIVTNLKNEVWISIPPSISKVLNPIIYFVISDVLKIGNNTNKSYLEFILNPSLPTPDDLKSLIPGKGFRYFYENFDYIMDVFLNRYHKTKHRKFNNILKIFLEKYKDRLFTSKLPIMSKFLQPSNVKPGTNVAYVDKSLKEILKSIIALLSSKYAYVLDKSYKNIEKCMFKAYKSYIDYYFEIVKSKLSRKTGYFRKNVYGSRLHFTFRNVISPIVEEHMSDEIIIPWKTGLTDLQFHLINILVNRFHLTPIQAYNLIYQCYFTYNPIIDQIFQLLILESKFKGLPKLQNRNPSLLTSNIVLHFIHKIKPCIIPISKKFIKLYGKLDTYNQYTNNYIYDPREIFISRLKVVESNGYDTPEIIQHALTNDIDTIHTPEGKTLTRDQLIYLIEDKTVQIPYLNAKYLNADFDGDHLNFASILESDMALYMLDRIHPSNFFIGSGQLKIWSRNNIPRQNLINLHRWLNDND